MEFDLDSGGAIYKRRVKSVKAGNLIKYFLPSSSAYLIFEEFVIRGNRRLHYGFDDDRKSEARPGIFAFYESTIRASWKYDFGKKSDSPSRCTLFCAFRLSVCKNVMIHDEAFQHSLYPNHFMCS